uniref:Uncharacterized protein n=1 Tax=Panagrolaimus sp. PS1159 TaxID=55785 RepID=A0AC35FDY0_9BILA
MSQSALYLPNRTVILTFHSSSKLDFDHSGSQAWPVNDSIAVGTFKLVATAVPPPTINSKITISSETIIHVIKMNKMEANSVQTIELSKELRKENDNLELIFATSDIEYMISCITLYDDENMNVIRQLNVFNTSIILGTSLTIYKHSNCNNEFTEFSVKAKNVNSINCVFHNNFINLEDIMKTTKIFSMIAGSIHSCQLTLINKLGGEYAIKNLWTTSKNQNVLVFNDANDSVPIFQFNSKTTAKWRNIILNAMAYSFIIPIQSSLIIEFYSPFPSILFNEPLESFYETPFYGTSNFRSISYNQTYEICEGLLAMFTVSDIDLSDKGMLMIIDD